MDGKATNYQTLFRQHIHENLLLREQSRSLATVKISKLKELNTAEANFKAKYQKYVKLQTSRSRSSYGRISASHGDVSPRPPFIICKDFPYSLKAWDNLTDVCHDKNCLDIYKSEVLHSEEDDGSSPIRQRSATIAESDLGSKIARFRDKRNLTHKSVQNESETKQIRPRSQSFNNVRLRRKQMTPNTVNPATPNECVTSESTSVRPSSSATGKPPVSYVSLSRSPERVSRSRIPAIVLTNEDGVRIEIEGENTAPSITKVKTRRSLSIPNIDASKVRLLQRRKSCYEKAPDSRSMSSLGGVKIHTELDRMLKTSKSLSVSLDYMNGVKHLANTDCMVLDSYAELKKCRYLRGKDGTHESDTNMPLPSMVMPPINGHRSTPTITNS